jgi:hypothetical protein
MYIVNSDACPLGHSGALTWSFGTTHSDLNEKEKESQRSENGKWTQPVQPRNTSLSLFPSPSFPSLARDERLKTEETQAQHEPDLSCAKTR